MWERNRKQSKNRSRRSRKTTKTRKEAEGERNGEKKEAR